MKKINLLIVGIVAMFGFMFAAQAQSASLQCDKTTIGIGETTNCFITLETEAVATETVISLSSSKHLSVTEPVANSAAGWVKDDANTRIVTGGGISNYAFKNTTGTKSSQVFAFKITLLESARKLSEGDECGQVCISAVTVNGANMTGIEVGSGTCFTPTVVEDECVGENCDPKNPQTGAFMNYLIILGVGIAAIAVILIVRRTTKFYRV